MGYDGPGVTTDIFAGIGIRIEGREVTTRYVQANPVPNPDLLPLTRDEAVLLSIEGSEDMQTEEPIKEQPAARTTSRNVLVAVGAFAVVIVIGLVAALLMNSSASGPVAAADAFPAVVFDGSTCTYDGPTQIEEGTVEFTTTDTIVVDAPLLEGVRYYYRVFNVDEFGFDSVASDTVSCLIAPTAPAAPSGLIATVGNRLVDAGITYRIAGENLALAASPDEVHSGLMDSEGHRANILSPEFRRVGIGVVVGPLGLMAVQVFTG